MFEELVTEETNQTYVNLFRQILINQEKVFCEENGKFNVSGNFYQVQVFNWFQMNPSYEFKRECVVSELVKTNPDIHGIFQIDYNTKEQFMWKNTADGIVRISTLQEFLNLN
jgi:hypothetical protein